MPTHIPLSPELIAIVEREAAARGLSLADFVAQTLEKTVAEVRSQDTLFSDSAVYRDDGPDDAAANHDDYLYGE